MKTCSWGLLCIAISPFFYMIHEKPGHDSSLVLTCSLRHTPKSILHFWGASCTQSQDPPLNSLINAIRFPQSLFSAEPSLLSIGLSSTMVFWTGNLRRHHSTLLFGSWPAAPAKLQSRMGISATVCTSAHTQIHKRTYRDSWPGRTGTSPTASVISYCTGKHWSGLGAQLYYSVCVCVCVSV